MVYLSGVWHMVVLSVVSGSVLVDSSVAYGSVLLYLFSGGNLVYL